jgi:phospholipid/cholesterol/gamma-HCH transport system substrate-binding protein
MELDFNKKEKTAGIFIIGIAILLLATVVIIGRGKDWFKTYITYYTAFEESYNLMVDTPVKLFNADIGKVKNITLVGDKVKVKLKILKDYQSRIRTDSVATVESPTLIGSEYISIIPGSEDAPLIPQEGDIPSRAKRSITDLLNEFQVEKTMKMVVDAVQEISRIVLLLRDPGGPLFAALDNANKTLVNIEKITRNISSGKGTLGNIVQSRDLLDHIHQNLDKVEDAVDTLKTILSNIEKGSHDIPKVTQSATKGIHEIRSAVEDIDEVVQSLKQNFLIRSNLPPEIKAENVDAGLRP